MDDIDLAIGVVQRLTGDVLWRLPDDHVLLRAGGGHWVLTPADLFAHAVAAVEARREAPWARELRALFRDLRALERNAARAGEPRC